jgi:hypothetical protein
MAKLKFVFAEVELAQEGDPQAIGQLIRSALAIGGTPQAAIDCAPARAALPAPAATLDPPASPRAAPVETTAERRPKARRKRKAEAEAEQQAGRVSRGESSLRQVRLESIERFLTNVGSATTSEIARKCNVPTGSITPLLAAGVDAGMFRRTEDGSYRVD